MSLHDSRMDQLRQALRILEELKISSGKKIILSIEAIQLFTKLDFDFPKKKDEITELILQVKNQI